MLVRVSQLLVRSVSTRVTGGEDICRSGEHRYWQKHHGRLDRVNPFINVKSWVALVLSSSVVKSSGSLLVPNDASQLDLEEASLDWHWFPNALHG